MNKPTVNSAFYLAAKEAQKRLLQYIHSSSGIWNIEVE